MMQIPTYEEIMAEPSLEEIEAEERLNILDEHAAFLKALTEIDSLLDKMQYVKDFEEAMELASQMDNAMPESIIATRKDTSHA